MGVWQREMVSLCTASAGLCSLGHWVFAGSLRRGDQLLEANGKSLLGVLNER